MYDVLLSFLLLLLLPLRLFLLVFADILAVLFARCRQTSTWTSRLQWAAPDLNSGLQNAVGSAGPKPGALERTGQRRTSTGELWSGLGNAGPHPGTSQRSGQRRTSAARRYVRRCLRNMSEKIVRKNVRRYSRERLRRVPFKNLLWYSFPYHHHHHLIITSSSSHHLIIIIIFFSLSLSLSLSLFFFLLPFSSPSLSVALLSLLFSAHCSGVENHARANPLRESGC